MQGAPDHKPATRSPAAGCADAVSHNVVRAFALHFVSRCVIPGAVRVEPEGPAPALTIAAGEARLDDVTVAADPYRFRAASASAGAALLFSAPGVARYLCRPDQGIAIMADPAADEEHVAALLIATALPALMWMRGGYMLHAAAFVPPGQSHAIAISAPSGGGKSTLLAAALSRGARIVADDSLCLRTSEGMIIGSGLPGGYFTPDRRFTPAAAEAQTDCAPVSTLVILDRSGDAPPHIERLAGIAALEALLGARHRPTVPVLVETRARHLATSSELVRHLRIFRLHAGTADPATTLDLIYNEMVS